MLKRPSTRRKSDQKQIELNLVPILDTLVTLIAFLLFTMSFFAFVHIETPIPQMSAEDVREKLKEKPLQLTLSLRETEAEIWSPFEKIAPRKIPNSAPGTPDIAAIHAALIAIKQQFPTENKIVLAPNGGINYDSLVSVMDSVRLVEATDPPIFAKNAQTGVDEQIKKLFPDVVFGNLISPGGEDS